MLKRSATALIAFGLMAGAPVAAQQTKLTYGSYLPQIHTIHVEGIEPLAKRLNAESGGNITLELFSGGVIAKAAGAVDSIRDRMVSAGKITDTAVSKQLPYSFLATELALLGRDPMVMGPATNEFNMLHCAECKADQAREGILPLAYYSTTPHVLICKQPLRSLDELKGKKVRASGAYAIMYKAFGMVPVNLPHEDSYEAFERGQIDCADSVDAWLRTLSIWDVARNVLSIDIGTYHGGAAFAINAALWKSLPADQKAIIKRNMPILVADIIFGYLKEARTVREEADKKGVKFLSPDPGFIKALSDYRAIELARVKELAKKRGMKNTDALIDTYLGLVEKWEKINREEIKGDKDKFIAALNREIYSKVSW